MVHGKIAVPAYGDAARSAAEAEDICVQRQIEGGRSQIAQGGIMDFIKCNELHDAEGRVYRVESYEAAITSDGTEINGEFSGPVPWKKAPKMPGNRQIGHLGHLPMAFFASNGRIIGMEEHDDGRSGSKSDVPHFIDAAGNTVYLNGDAERHEPDDDDAHSDMRTIFESKVERIITNGRSTIVCWKDGTKTRVALSACEDTDGNVYEGFMWACVKKLFGSHRRFERLVDGVHVDQDRRGEKPGKPGKPAGKPAKRACRSGRKNADAKHL